MAKMQEFGAEVDKTVFGNAHSSSGNHQFREVGRTETGRKKNRDKSRGARRRQEYEDYNLALALEEQWNGTDPKHYSEESSDVEVNPAIQDFINTVTKGNVFGQCNPEDFQTTDSERKVKERKIQLQKKKQMEELRRTEEEKRKQEEDDFYFAMEEDRKLNKYFSSKQTTEPRSSTGRGRSLLQQSEQEMMPSWVTGRGQRFRRDMQEGLDSTVITRRDNRIRDQINKWGPGESHYNNNRQVKYWHGPQVGERLSPPSTTPTTDSSEQFEDALGSTLSLHSYSPPSEASPFLSAASSASASPAPASSAPGSPAPASPVPASPRSPKKSIRKPRMAAVFPSKVSEKDNDELNTNQMEETEEPEDRFAILASLARPLVPPSVRVNQGGPSINSLCPNRRVLYSQLLRPEDLLRPRYDTTDHGFTMSEKDFPTL